MSHTRPEQVHRGAPRPVSYGVVTSLGAALRRGLLGAALALPVVLVASLVPADAAAMEASDLVAKVGKKYADVKTMRADFVQTTRSETFGDEVTKGKLVVERPAKMRWSFGDERVFVTDGKSMWIYSKADAQVIVYDDISAQRSTADSLLTSLDKLEELFVVTVESSTDEAHKLALKPKEEAQFKQVRLTLDAKLMITAVSIIDTFDNVTDLAFTNMELNVKTDDAMFSFAAPEGVDVVKATP